jgi:hypothetical protein
VNFNPQDDIWMQLVVEVFRLLELNYKEVGRNTKKLEPRQLKSKNKTSQIKFKYIYLWKFFS